MYIRVHVHVCKMAAVSTKAKGKRRELTIEEKVDVIKASSSKSQRKLAEEFGVGKTQVHSILKRKAELLRAYDVVDANSRKRICYRGDYDDVDDVVWRWFQRIRILNTPVSGPMIQEKAREFSKRLQKVDFKASNGWLARFKTRHNIRCATLSGERASVDSLTVESWRGHLPDIIKDYALRDIFNMDETGLFFRALPDKTLAVKGSDCAGGKKSKERLTVTVCVNAVGDFEKPLVIGHAMKPRCFKNVGPLQLPVVWTANKKAWMTECIFKDWATNFNQKMHTERRHVLLLLDNAPSHPHDLQLSNVTMQFLPANTTSVLQPLDSGIIKNIKCHYRKRLLRAVLSKIETASCAAEVAKSINCLDACHWVNAAVNDVKSSTVQNCFRKCGIEHVSNSSSPDLESDHEHELAPLLPIVAEQLQLSEPLSVEDYANIDNDAPAVEELHEGWEEQLITDFIAEKDASTSTQLEEDEKEDAVPKSTITSISSAMKWTSELKLFAAEKGLATVLNSFMSAEAELQKEFTCTCMHQTCIDSFFKGT